MSVTHWKFSLNPWLSAAVWLVALALPAISATDEEFREYMRQADEECQKAEAAWRGAGMPGGWTPEGEALMTAAIHADRPDIFEQVTAQGDPLKRMLPIPLGSRRVPLRVCHEFRGLKALFADETFASIHDPPRGWLVRRITDDAIEIWRPRYGWLFDGRGRLLHEARPVRHTGIGRQWYGAFLPDGCWVTTDVEEMDGILRFFSATGREERFLTCEQLAPRPQDGGANLIGWARSDREGKGWVVNVGSEGGWATVWIGPKGAARILQRDEKWALCYPRALGPRGMGLSLSVPDDSGQITLDYAEPGHGPGVGFPTYSSDIFEKDGNQEPIRLCIAGGNDVFGFWPERRDFFVGAENFHGHEVSGLHTRKLFDYDFERPARIIDKTWLFDSKGHLLSWIRARRIGDAADGKSMLFRVVADGRIITVGPNLRVSAMRRFVWRDGHTADALILWDDLRLGLFVRDERLFLAKW